MMIKCQKCGFENQMGSIFCRDCGEKLNMDAIDPNKLQKDVEKEKSIKLAKKRIKGAISASISILVVVAFVYLVFPGVFPFPSGLREFEESAVTEAIANQKFNAAANGTGAGEVLYSYADINKMLQVKVVDPLNAQEESFAKITGIEVAYDEEKKQPVAYMWISIKEKVPVLYTIHGNFVFKGEDGNPAMPITADVKRLDIGRLPVFVSTHTFLNGFNSILENEAMQSFFQRARGVTFSADGMSVNFEKGNPSNSMAPQASSSSSNKPSSSSAAAALKGGSTAASEKAEAARQKAEEEKARKKELEEERKRKAEEEAQKRREKEEERKRKIEEEKERKREAEEERKRRIEEENERRRQEAEDRRREREERRNNNSRSSRNGRSSRNRY